MKNFNVLITCGPTWVAIDQVRVISNVSSGEMGHLIADAFLKIGANVTVIEGPVTHPWQGKRARIIKYQFFDELSKTLKAQLRNKPDIVIHAAAVSDFKVTKVSKTKIASGKALSLALTPTEKLIQAIKAIAPNTCLVGFKLESKFNKGNIYKETKELFTESGCDLVVANSLNNGYQGFILDADGRLLVKTKTKHAIAQHLVSLLRK